MSTSAPIINTSIDQSFFIEAINGAGTVTSYLNDFPPEVYTHALDSHLVIFLYALLGPAGAGLVTGEYLEQRLQLEEGGLNNSDLDDLYTGAFSISRLTSETYLVDAESSLLPANQAAQLLSADSSFRNRAMLWLQAMRAGSSVLGISLAASSGLGQPVEAIENYKALFDAQSDIQLGIQYQGSTTSLSEVILVPRRVIATNSAQTFVLTGVPTIGYFSITVPKGGPYGYMTATNVATATGADYTYTITLPSVQNFAAGQFILLTNNAGDAIPSTCLSVNSQTNVITVQSPVEEASPEDYTLLQYSQGQTGPIAYNATASDIQIALQSLPTVGGPNNISVTGGPLPDVPITITFMGALANVELNDIAINLFIDPFTTIGKDGSQYPLAANTIIDNVLIGYTLTEATASTSVDSANLEFAPQDLKYMMDAVDQIMPQSIFITVAVGKSLYTRQPYNAVFADVNYTDVISYITGNGSVVWPPVNGTTNWVEAGLEHEAPQPNLTFSSQYANFHNIAGAVAYTQGAITDPNYPTMPDISSGQPFYVQYYNTHIGSYNSSQQALYPFLQQFQTNTQEFSPAYAIAPQNNRAVITDSLSEGIAIVNDIYPLTYFNLPGMNAFPVATAGFWSSVESTSGTDYLELDLGEAQAVNFLYFEATNKPYTLDVAYDTADQTPFRNFVTADINTSMPFTTSLNYSASATSPWTTVYLPITNSLSTMIYTRYIRIGFTKSAMSQPFVLSANSFIPYSIEVRNLRIGRLINSNGISNTSVA